MNNVFEITDKYGDTVHFVKGTLHAIVESEDKNREFSVTDIAGKEYLLEFNSPGECSNALRNILIWLDE